MTVLRADRVVVRVKASGARAERDDPSARPGTAAANSGSTTAQPPRKVADFPLLFTAKDMCIANGVAFIGGYITIGTNKLPAIYYYVNSSTGLLWKATTKTGRSDMARDGRMG